MHLSARTALASVRLTVGGVALLAPKRFVASLGVDPKTNGAAVYALRMFGIRTVVIGFQLLTAGGEELERAVRWAPYIHATDALAAALGGISGGLTRRAAITGGITSSVNTALALLARRSLP
jgi:hypothetical protein